MASEACDGASKWKTAHLVAGKKVTTKRRHTPEMNLSCEDLVEGFSKPGAQGGCRAHFRWRSNETPLVAEVARLAESHASLLARGEQQTDFPALLADVVHGFSKCKLWGSVDP
mmetsp:Transcript_145744/g.465650  ORF Transcript_145744/g.465650 Transcript_145744/m.465650 type:complete len:113 (+) Transcript_145744:337-675(+)